jgi:hypothetical protein
MVATAIRDNYRRSLIAENLIEDFGHGSACGVKIMSALAQALAKSLKDVHNNKTKMLFEEWQALFGQVADLSTEQIQEINRKLRFKVEVPDRLKIPGALFVIHTFNSLIIKLLAAEIISAHKLTSYEHFAQTLSIEPDALLLKRLENEIERGEFYSTANIFGFVEEALFSWYLDACNENAHKEEIIDSLREILIKLSFYRTDNLTQARSKDLLKVFYQNLVPETLRKTLGEFYTPDWLVDFTIQRAGKIDWLKNRTLDPTCGSGSFLIEVIKQKVATAKHARWKTVDIIKHITDSVWGFDLNPLAVQTARVNFLIYIADLLKEEPGEQVEIPILLADAIYSPARDPDDDEHIVRYTIGSQKANLEITLPSELALDRALLDEVFKKLGQYVEDGLEYNQAEKKLLKTFIVTKKQVENWRGPIKLTYEKVFELHKNNWNGIWFRIIRNFFWSSVAGRFSLIAGNPPWVRWSKLPELYRERVKPTCMNYNIFSSTPHHGGNELDISGMITYTVADKWLETGGILAFVITQTHFQSPSSEGFRDFKINDKDSLLPLHIDDLKGLRPFPDAANKTAVAIFKKAQKVKPSYPVQYKLWREITGYSKSIPVNLRLDEVLHRIEPIQLEATPVTASNSPWAILPPGRFRQLQKIAGKCAWVQGRKGITADLNGIYFVEITGVNTRHNIVKVQTRPEAGKRDIGPAQTFWVEPDLLYPLIKGASDFSRCFFERKHSLFVFVPNHGINKESYEEAVERLDRLRKTEQYFKTYEGVLEKRSTFKGRMKNAPYYAIYNVGEYTFAPFKVIWAEQKDFCAAVATSAEVPLLGARCFVPDHKLFFVDFNAAEPAFFLCGLLNSDLVIEWVKSHNISIQIGDIFKHMNLPEYNVKDPKHKKLSLLAKKCHNTPRVEKREELIIEMSRLAEEIIDHPLF